MDAIHIKDDDVWVGKQPIKCSAIKRLVIVKVDDNASITMPWNLSNGETIKGIQFPSNSIPQVQRFFHEKVSKDIQFLT